MAEPTPDLSGCAGMRDRGSWSTQEVGLTVSKSKAKRFAAGRATDPAFQNLWGERGDLPPRAPALRSGGGLLAKSANAAASRSSSPLGHTLVQCRLDLRRTFWSNKTLS